MPALGAGIHVFLIGLSKKQDVDGRNKSGHDGTGETLLGQQRNRPSVARMNLKLRTIEIDARIADVLEARAAARGLSVADLIADLAWTSETLPPDLQAMCDSGTWAVVARGAGGRCPASGSVQAHA